MPSHSGAVNNNILVYILFCTDDHGLEKYVRKTVRASIDALSQENLERRLKKCFDLSRFQHVKLLRRSKKSQKYVNLETEVDYKVLARSAALKKCVFLVMISEESFDYYKNRTSVFDKYLSRKTPNSLPSPSSSVSTLESSDQHIGSDISSPPEIPSTSDMSSASIDGFSVNHSLKQDHNDSVSDATKEYINSTYTKFLADLEGRLTDQIKNAVNSVATKSSEKIENKGEPKLGTDSQNTTTHYGVLCNSCCPVGAKNTYPIKGVRYKCLDCFDFDLCQKCERSGVLVENHSAVHTMIKIAKPLAVQKHANVIKKDFIKPKSSSKLHFGIFCDSCDPEGKGSSSPIKGCRYKCTECEDFDLCETCEAKGFTNSTHKSDHIMAKISTPVDTHLSLPKIIKTVDHEVPNFPNIYCDSCWKTGNLNPIITKGVCFYCTVCTDFHLCESCHTQKKEVSSHSSSHKMKAMLPASLVDSDPVFSAALKDAAQSKDLSAKKSCIKCESKYVESLRYQCTVCNNFNLCHDCNLSGFERYFHSSLHKMNAIIDNQFYEAKKVEFGKQSDKNAEFAQFAANHGVSSKDDLSSLITRSSFFSELCSLISDVTNDSSDENIFKQLKGIINEHKSQKKIVQDDIEIEELSATVETLDISLDSQSSREKLKHEENEAKPFKLLEDNTATVETGESNRSELSNFESSLDINKALKSTSESSNANKVKESSFTSINNTDYEEYPSSTTIALDSPLKSSSILILPKIGKQDSSMLIEQENVSDPANQENHSANGDDVVSSWSCESDGETSEFEILDSDIGF